MSAEVERWEDEPAPVALMSRPTAPAPPSHDIDSWVQVASAFTKLANQIANTDFPPTEMRGKPEAIVAAFLMGREMGLGPMTSLMNLHVIKGKVGQSAHLMRAQILSKGHEVEYDEVSDTRCVIRGRRRGEDAWTFVTYTADQARRAKIDLGGYPEDKLIARATARLARRKFADVISGMAYSVEELGDGDYAFEDDAVQVAEASAATASGETGPEPKRTVRRSTPTRTAPTRTASATRRRQASSDETAVAGPPLPDEPESQQGSTTTETSPGTGHGRPDTQKGSADPGDQGGRGEQRDAAASPPAEPETAMVTKPQLGKIGVLFDEAKVSGRDARLRVVSSMVDRPIASSTELTQDEASELIDNLQDLGPDGIAATAGAPEPAGTNTRDQHGEQGQLGDDEPEPEEEGPDA